MATSAILDVTKAIGKGSFGYAKETSIVSLFVGFTMLTIMRPMSTLEMITQL